MKVIEKKGLIPNNFWTMKFKGKRIDNFRIKMGNSIKAICLSLVEWLLTSYIAEGIFVG